MLWRYAGKPIVKTNVFPGISPQAYYFNAINWAYSKGIISNKLFYPNNDCTREMLIVYIYRYNNYLIISQNNMQMVLKKIEKFVIINV